MADFSFWVILSNLIAATRWTVALSLIAFVSGGLVGLLLLFCRTSHNKPLELLTKGYIEFFQGTPLSLSDTTRASLWDDGTRVTSLDTTASDGTAGRRLRVRSLLLPTKPDSFVVIATVRYRGAPVRGSPVRFVIRTQPR